MVKRKSDSPSNRSQIVTNGSEVRALAGEFFNFTLCNFVAEGFVFGILNFMNVRKIDLNQVLDTVELPDFTKAKTNLHFIKYTCPNCSEIIAFKRDDFKKHWYTFFSNFSPENQAEFSKFEKVNNIEKIPFLDFVCPGNCKSLTRIYYRGIEGPKSNMGIFGYEVICIAVASIHKSFLDKLKDIF